MYIVIPGFPFLKFKKKNWVLVGIIWVKSLFAGNLVGIKMMVSVLFYGLSDFRFLLYIVIMIQEFFFNLLVAVYPSSSHVKLMWLMIVCFC